MDMSRLSSFSTEQLRNLNRAVCDEIRTRLANESYERACKFRVGQVVQFRDKQGKTRLIKVERINVKSVSGKEVGGYMNWRVHPSLISVAE